MVLKGGESVNFARFLFWMLLAWGAISPSWAALGDDEFERGYDAYDQHKYSEAAALWRKAADLGHARAQNGLGVLYRDGIGVKRDPKEAVRWFQESASRGYAFGMYNLALMYKDGIGVMRNDVEAYKWFYLASTINFDVKADFERNALATRMNDSQVAEAKRRAQEWFDRFFFGATLNQRARR
jgi:hypothetical protein